MINIAVTLCLTTKDKFIIISPSKKVIIDVSNKILKDMCKFKLYRKPWLEYLCVDMYYRFRCPIDDAEIKVE